MFPKFLPKCYFFLSATIDNGSYRISLSNRGGQLLVVCNLVVVMFAEGLAECYAKATYALFKVNTKGEPILADLVGDNLNSLQCEKRE